MFLLSVTFWDKNGKKMELLLDQIPDYLRLNHQPFFLKAGFSKKRIFRNNHNKLNSYKAEYTKVEVLFFMAI